MRDAHTITLRERSVPRFALRKAEAASSLGISTSLFDDWIKKGYVPEGRRINGVVLWGVDAIQSAWLRMSEGEPENDDGCENPFDRMVV